MSFIVQISPIVHLFTLKIVFRWGALPADPSPQVVPTFHFMHSYASGMNAHSCHWIPRMCTHMLTCHQ